MAFCFVVDLFAFKNIKISQAATIVASQFLPLVYFFIQFKRGQKTGKKLQETAEAVQSIKVTAESVQSLIENLMGQRKAHKIPNLVIKVGDSPAEGQDIDTFLANRKKETEAILYKLAQFQSQPSAK